MFNKLDMRREGKQMFYFSLLLIHPNDEKKIVPWLEDVSFTSSSIYARTRVFS